MTKSKLDFIRAWKDENYRLSLSADELAQMPAHPVGIIDLSDSELDVVVGASTEHLQTLGCCGGLTSDPGFCSWLCGDTKPGTATQCHTECGTACPSKTYDIDIEDAGFY